MPDSANMFSSGMPASLTRLMITCWTAELTPKSPQPRHHQALSPVMSARLIGVILMCQLPTLASSVRLTIQPGVMLRPS